MLIGITPVDALMSALTKYVIVLQDGPDRNKCCFSSVAMLEIELKNRMKKIIHTHNYKENIWFTTKTE